MILWQAAVEKINLLGGTGNDSLQGDGDNDTLDGGEGVDTLAGGLGDDLLYVRAGDSANGQDGADVLRLLGGSSTATGGSGEDRFVVETTGEGLTTITDFTVGDDKIDLSGWHNITGLSDLAVSQNPSGNAVISFDFGAKSIVVTLAAIQQAQLSADDFVFYGAEDILFGTSGNDNINGTSDADYIDGLTGNDTISAGDGDDTIDGGEGVDRLTGGAGSDIFIVSETTHSYRNNSDTIVDFGAGDKIDLSAFNFTDVVEGASDPGQIQVFYNSGNNTTFLRHNVTNGLEIKVTGDHVADFADDSDEYFIGLTGPETSQSSNNFTGDAGNNSMQGNANANLILGLGGTDTLLGLDGNDTLDGGSGRDTLTGGNGVDFFKFSAIGDSVRNTADLITDFADGTDKIDVSGLNYSSLVTSGGAGRELQVFFNSSKGWTIIRNYEDNFEIAVSGDHTSQLDASDFLGLTG